MKIEKTSYGIYGACYKLSNDDVEVYVTLDVGPRIICYRFIGRQNVLGELGSDIVVATQWGEWRPWGGHRLWHAPEHSPRSYVPDNTPVEAEQIDDRTVRVVQPLEQQTGIQKEMHISLDAAGTGVRITHKLTNNNPWAIEMAPWALTIMNGNSPGGTTIFPQEPFKAHSDGALLPARPLVLWPYTDMADSRWKFGTKFVYLSTDPEKKFPQKIGAANKMGWAAYLRSETLFVKRFDYHEGATYPDYGCNFETFTNGTFMEVETMGPLSKVEPGESAIHVEAWFLFRDVTTDLDDESIERTIVPLVRGTKL